MIEPQARPGIIKRVAPWLLAIAVGIGFGGWIGGAFAPDGPDADRPATSTRPAPPPVVPKTAAAPAPARAPANAAPLGPPMTLAISNRDCNWGADFDGYYRQAATILLHAGGQAGRDAQSVRVRVPDRPWNGLTVTAVEAIYEGSGIVFAQPLTEVRAALTAAGIRVTADGSIPFDDADNEAAVQAVAVQAVRATSGSAVRYGATVLTCGA